jgi:glycosyltransferase involved in cell wall biosynthesis
MATNAPQETADLAAAPMHGEVKLRGEGLRTRDGHFLEWFTKLCPASRVAVYSRPEPWPRVTLARVGGAPMPEQLSFISPQPKTIPNIRHPRDWWIGSMRFMPSWSSELPAVIWNPIAGAAMLEQRSQDAPVVFDLLDDWLVHPAFVRIAEQVERAYKSLFDRVSVVTANSEATLALAHKFGRDDAFLLRNGVDPERFALPPCAHKQVTVGYGGKLGFRVDVELVGSVAAALPYVRFECAGPVLSKEQARALRRIPNVVLVGDVRYDRYPNIMRKWDIAWAPHRLGEFEVGGDLIKLYEYRAAGLPTVSTRVIGWERALEGVRAVPREEVVQALTDLIGGHQAGEIPREPVALPKETSWQAKAEFLLDRLDMTDDFAQRDLGDFRRAEQAWGSGQIGRDDEVMR